MGRYKYNWNTASLTAEEVYRYAGQTFRKTSLSGKSHIMEDTMITREQIIENELMDMDVLSYIPTECPVCGSDIAFTDSLKQIYCVNKQCALKVAARLENMAKAMKADGWEKALA